MLQPSAFVPLAYVQGVQRDVSLDLSCHGFADDADKQTSTLRIVTRVAYHLRLAWHFDGTGTKKSLSVASSCTEG
jgi:hypothetical protein